MKFYVVIRRKRDIGSFRKSRWVPHTEFIYLHHRRAVKDVVDFRKAMPQYEFDVLHCNADGPKR